MAFHSHNGKFVLGKRSRSISPTKIIAASFAAISLLGALLLALPAASRSGVSCGLWPALFTATSAACVTGLTLFDTWTQWSGFGQTVIIILVELGGLGFMSAASLVIFLLHRKVGLKERLVMAHALSVTDMEGIVHLQKTVLVGSLGIQGAGALILLLRFWPEYGFATALRWGIFHSISAFCNAGFDIFGVIRPGSGAMAFNSDPVVLLTFSGLIILGGLGFLVWEEMARLRSFKKYSVYAKLVLISSGVLLVFGTVCYCALEWNNPHTLGPMSLGNKLLNGFYQSVTVRTAGLTAIDQNLMTDASKALTVVMMFIGGASGSTAGGAKAVTVMVLLLFLWARSRGKTTVTVFKRTIPNSQVLDAMTIVSVLMGLAVVGSIFVCATSPVDFLDAVLETASALTTGGITGDMTARLSWPAQVLILVYTYFGRVGVLTISLGFLMGNRAEERFRYAQTSLLIG